MKVRNLLESGNIEELKLLVEDNCSVIMSQYNSGDWEKVLYRGMRDIGPFGVVKVRKNRRPVDMPMEFHRVADTFFEEKFGVAARSGTVMCTTDIHMAKEFAGGYSGKGGRAVYVLFPYDPFSIIYSTKVEDMFTALERGDADSFLKQSDSVGEPREAGFLRWLHAMDYRQTRDVNQVWNGSEMMVDCDRYVAVKQEFVRRLIV